MTKFLELTTNGGRKLALRADLIVSVLEDDPTRTAVTVEQGGGTWTHHVSEPYATVARLLAGSLDD